MNRNGNPKQRTGPEPAADHGELLAQAKEIRALLERLLSRPQQGAGAEDALARRMVELGRDHARLLTQVIETLGRIEQSLDHPGGAAVYGD